MLGAKDLFPGGEDTTMFRLGFGGFASVIESNRETVPDQQRVRMLGPQGLFESSQEGAQAGDGFIVFALAILRVSDAGPAAKGIGVFGAERLLAGFGGCAHDLFRFAVGALFHEQIAYSVLDVGPLAWVARAVC